MPESLTFAAGINEEDASKGFSLLEALLVLCFGIGIILLLAPIVRLAEGRSAHISAAVDVRIWGEAIAAYREDQGHLPLNPNGLIHYRHQFVKELLPYLKAVRIVNTWGYPYRIWTGEDNILYGYKTAREDYFVACFGMDDSPEKLAVDLMIFNETFFKVKAEEDFDKDTLLFNGRFIRRFD